MPTLDQIRTALCSQLELSGIHTHPRWPGNINLPAAIVQKCEPEYEQTFGDGSLTKYTAELALLVNTFGIEDAETQLDAYLDPVGNQSLRTAIRVDPTLGGVVDYAVVLRSRDGPLLAFGGREFVGALVDMEIWA